MAFCSNCGSQATGTFCPNCGTALGAGAAGTGSAGTGSAGYVPPAGASASGLTPNIVSALCYLLGIIGGVIFLVIAPYNQDRLIRFHAFQSIFFTVAYIACFLVLGILGTFTHGVMFLLYPLLQLAFLIGWIYMIVTAYQGKKVVLPVIGELAEKQA